MLCPGQLFKEACSGSLGALAAGGPSSLSLNQMARRQVLVVPSMSLDTGSQWLWNKIRGSLIWSLGLSVALRVPV